MDNDRQNYVPAYMDGKVVAIFGYEYEGLEQARMLRAGGVEVLVALRQGSSSKMWEEAGFDITNIYDAADRADIFQVW